MIADRVRALLDECRPGFSLPRAFYVDEDFYRADLAAVFETDWLFACNVAEIRGRGDYVTLDVGANPVIVLRDLDGEIRAFHNTCRHRGSRLCRVEKGRVKRLICPYHQWVYELDGRLRNARQMPGDFDKAAWPLKPVNVEVICGLVYISLSDAPPSLDAYRAAITPYIAPHHPERTKVAFEMTIVEEANWKLVIENNRECYHCAANHPELLVSLLEYALPDDIAGNTTFNTLVEQATTKWDRLGLPHRPADGGVEFRCLRLPFNEEAVAFTLDGRPASTKLLGDFTDPDLGSVRMFRVPNNWNHFLADHVMHARVLPLGPDRTAVKTTWLVHEDAVEGVDYDVKRLTEVWIATNEQDRELAENNHAGVRSMAYSPGPYAPSEFMLGNFGAWYVKTLTEHFAPLAPQRVAAE